MDSVVTAIENDDLVIRKINSDGPFVQIDPTVSCVIHVVAVDLARAATTGSGA